MPGGDRTGPMGMGPMTGRGMGFCAGNAAPGFTTWGGRGMGGRGRGWRRQFYATGLTGWQRQAAGWPVSGGVVPAPVSVDPQAELQALEQQAQALTQALESLRGRMEQLRGNKSAE